LTHFEEAMKGDLVAALRLNVLHTELLGTRAAVACFQRRIRAGGT
jgi:hypothetical protein